ncbi:MAG: hypothetical protein LAQ30_18930 [Acidobacteriia bacterium]|nr:hypothetical protein [Terriglobia bacterium]
METYERRRNARFTGVSAEDEKLQRNLLKLRAVLILLAARHGSKLATVRTLVSELRAKELRASNRSLYFWRLRYLRAGFAGIARRRRNDRGCPHTFGEATLHRIVEAAIRVKRNGDVAREYRRLRLGISYEVFRLWVRKIQRQLRVIEMPAGEERIGLLG